MGHRARGVMSGLGQNQTSSDVRITSALPPKADIAGRLLDVRFVPTTILAIQKHREKFKRA
jgi:hypothetical protein